jgi:hypothetical protein
MNIKKIAQFDANTLNLINTLIVFTTILSARLILIGLPPYADEGFYASNAYFIYLGYKEGLFTSDSIIPVSGGIGLYSLLRSWVFFLPLEPYFLLRSIDAIVASCATLAIYKYLTYVTGKQLPAFVSSVLIGLAMNHPDFIEAGSRNSIAFGTLFLFLSLYLIERYNGEKLFVSACCISLAVLGREPFVIFAVILAIYVLINFGIQKTLNYCLIAIIFGSFIILIIAMLKGGIQGITSMYSSYFNTAKIVSNPEWNLSFSDQTIRAIANTKTAIQAVYFIVPIFILGLFSPLVDRSLKNKKYLTTYSFGIALVLASFPEIFLKRSYPYHVAQTLIGANIIFVYGFISLANFVIYLRKITNTAASILIGLIFIGHILLIQNYVRTMRYSSGWSIHYAPVMILGDWSSPAVKDSFFLEIASLIKSNSQPDDRILSTTKSIYALATRKPLSLETADLAQYLLQKIDTEEINSLMDLIHEYKPHVFMMDTTANTMSKMPYLFSQLNKISNALADLYNSPISVGPGLAPYRQFSTDVYIAKSVSGSSK